MLDNDPWSKATFTAKYAVVYDERPWWKRFLWHPRSILYVDFETGKMYKKRFGKLVEIKEKRKWFGRK